MKLLSRIAAAMGAMLLGLGVGAAAAAAQSAAILAPNPPAAQTAPTGHALTAEDAAAYFDGLIPYAISRADIAGAVVVVVKDGQPLLARGYGLSDVKARRPVDPDTTLFRPGSVSKLFTWTAVMQQVEGGKIDLDADVNRYLDFRIPAYDGKPLTMRQLMTHSSGFSDPSRNLIIKDPKRLKSLETLVKTEIPERIYPPGTTVAYSNYGAGLAGYIVQRVSGEPFERYVARHIFARLGMTHSTFEQPLPQGWSANMSKGYRTASGAPGPYELIGLSPAGGLASSGSDMARFMIAHLQDGEYGGQRILGAKTAQLMHSPQFRPVPSIPSMALGFYQEPGNGHRVIAHAGNSALFHSDLHLYLDDHVGLFISLNSGGLSGASVGIRTSLFKGFTDRYFPAPKVEEPPTWANAKADGQTLAGYYIETRRSDSGWLRLPAFLLGQTKITADPTGVVTVSSYRGLNNQPQHWREIGPFQYQEVGGVSRMAAVVRDGKVIAIMPDDRHPVESLQPVSPMMSAAWNLPVFKIMLAILAIASVSWPLAAFIRWRYGRSFMLTGRAATLHRLTRAVCVLGLIFVGLWYWFMSHRDIQWLSSETDGIIRMIQVVGLLCVVGALAPLANAATVIADSSRSWFAKVSSVSIAWACLAGIWFMISLRLITLHIAY